MTVNETVHLNDGDDYENYINNKHWSEHERTHIWQEQEYHGGNAIGFVGKTILGYIFAFSHDGSPYEIEAEAATTKRYAPPPLSGAYAWF